ncbi:MAG TPA: folylpolyglutamate synthase/dihydrofolate synthase family protein [Gemmataceae bacterium]|nr:folylpolyglutamate synthase/dihydrofolate synthase family protein [Gemmataceae bacterium]
MDHSLAAPPSLSPEQARAWWYGLINFEQRTPHADDLKLEHMRSLLARLDNPHQRLRIVHVAGSKGKGSTAAMLASILRQAGYRTGLFTSPHLCRVEERFQVDGQAISLAELTALLDEIRHCVEAEDRSGGVPYTFFEVATAVGFLHFVRRRVEAAVLEVGLGGRLDSTNVCQPIVSVITSISFDHTNLLGDRLAAIAAEKAGIIKLGRPVISGTTVPEARAVIERISRERRSPLRQLGVDFRYTYTPGRVTATQTQLSRVSVTTEHRRWPEFQLNLLGDHQAANAAVAVACVEALLAEGWRLPDAAVATGLAEVSWPARLEVVARRPLIALDCAHNVASALALVRTLQTSFPPARRLLVFAGSSDKDLAGMFRVLSPHFAHAFLTRYTDNPRSVSAERLAELLRANGNLSATLCPTPADAYRAAHAAAASDDVIVITGSVFLAGELRPLLVGG